MEKRRKKGGEKEEQSSGENHERQFVEPVGKMFELISALANAQNHRFISLSHNDLTRARQAPDIQRRATVLRLWLKLSYISASHRREVIWLLTKPMWAPAASSQDTVLIFTPTLSVNIAADTQAIGLDGHKRVISRLSWPSGSHRLIPLHTLRNFFSLHLKKTEAICCALNAPHPKFVYWSSNLKTWLYWRWGLWRVE